MLAGKSRDSMIDYCFSRGYKSESVQLGKWIQKITPELPDDAKPLIAEVSKAIMVDCTIRPTAMQLWRVADQAGYCGACCHDVNNEAGDEDDDSDGDTDEDYNDGRDQREPFHTGAEHDGYGHGSGEQYSSTAAQYGGSGQTYVQLPTQFGSLAIGEVSSEVNYRMPNSMTIWSDWIWSPEHGRNYRWRYNAQHQPEYDWAPYENSHDEL